MLYLWHRMSAKTPKLQKGLLLIPGKKKNPIPYFCLPKVRHMHNLHNFLSTKTQGDTFVTHADNPTPSPATFNFIWPTGRIQRHYSGGRAEGKKIKNKTTHQPDFFFSLPARNPNT